MAVDYNTRAKDALYHAQVATANWAAFVAALQPLAVRSTDARLRANAQRKRDTTYARGTLGGH